MSNVEESDQDLPYFIFPKKDWSEMPNDFSKLDLNQRRKFFARAFIST